MKKSEKRYLRKYINKEVKRRVREYLDFLQPTVSYIDVNSSGGDGTSNSTTGPHAAFSSLADWERESRGETHENKRP